jgi:hypothetical protein
MRQSIAVRESGVRNIDQPNGLGRGIWQIDLGAHPDVTVAQAHDQRFAANYAAGLLSGSYDRLSDKYGSKYGDGLVTAAAIREYNAGSKYTASKIKKGLGALNRGTTGNNYVNNVLDIARNCFGYKG